MTLLVLCATVGILRCSEHEAVIDDGPCLAADSVMMTASSFNKKGRKEAARPSIVKMRVARATRKVHQLEMGIALLGQA